jgi:hypothetical protein
VTKLESNQLPIRATVESSFARSTAQLEFYTLPQLVITEATVKPVGEVTGNLNDQVEITLKVVHVEMRNDVRAAYLKLHPEASDSTFSEVPIRRMELRTPGPDAELLPDPADTTGKTYVATARYDRFTQEGDVRLDVTYGATVRVELTEPVHVVGNVPNPRKEVHTVRRVRKLDSSTVVETH